MCVITLCRARKQPQPLFKHAIQIALAIRRQHAEDVGAGVFGEVGFFEDALGRVNVWKIEGGAGMARVKDGGEANAGGEGADHDAVHFVVCNVAYLAEIDGVDYFVVAIVFIAVEVFGLSTMALRRD